MRKDKQVVLGLALALLSYSPWAEAPIPPPDPLSSVSMEFALKRMRSMQFASPLTLSMAGRMSVCWREDRVEMVVTAFADGRHRRKSLHYQYSALDARIWNVSHRWQQRVVACAQRRLGPAFRVTFESDPDHVHAELRELNL